MPSLSLTQLRSLVDVIELGSFSAAAERRQLSQPAVSLQIRELERLFGLRLLERVGRRVQPTAAGAELLAHARHIGGAVEAAQEAMARHAGEVVGRVRIGSGATACTFLLPPLLRQLRRRFPALELTVATGNTADIVRGVEDNHLDVALVTLPASGRALAVTPLLDDEFVVIAPEGMALPARLTPAALTKLPVLLFEGGNTRRLIDDWFARGGTRLTPVMSMGSVEAIRKLVEAGLGCAVLPQMAVRQPRDRAGLVVRPLSPRLHRTLALVLRRDKPLHRGLREAVQALQALQTLPVA